jgi:two-component system nitrogen regulation sensor histidine kinase NtrY
VQYIEDWKNMASKPSQFSSFESKLKLVCWGILLILPLLVGWIMFLLDVSTLVVITVFTLFLIPVTLWGHSFYQQIINPFYRLTSLVEAIRLEDYSLRSTSMYKNGIVHDLFDEIGKLAEELQQRKQVYDQHIYLIYHLMEQLDTPIAVFDQKLTLSHANSAFSAHIQKPWQSLRYYSCEHLGLKLDESQRWVATDEKQSQRWQIRQSHFVQNEQKYHLVILTNIESALRKNQQQSWQQIIRVLSHEINNSLTPIKSLAQSLSELATDDQRSLQALGVIVDRSNSLQEFVQRYATVFQHFTLKSSWFASDKFVVALTTLFAERPIEVDNQVERLWADVVLLEQVLINLLKNAVEASADNTCPIKLKLSQQDNQLIISVIDQGQGITNPQNLFVPFYTTKANGHGVGLGLCQNIIEQHGGQLTLKNNKNGVGATARVVLPLQPLDN